MTLPSRLAVIALAVACAGGLVACGTPRVEPEATPSAPDLVLPTPAANDFVSTVMRTRGLGTAEATVDVTTTTGEGSVQLTGSGPVAINKGYGRLDWTSSDGGSFTEVSNGKGLFVRSEGPTGMWTHLPDKTSTPTSRLADPLRGIGTAMDVVRHGPEQVGDVTAVRYTGRIPATTESLALLGMSDEQITALGDSWRGQWIDLTVWVDQRGRIVRLERTLTIPDTEGGPVSATTVTTLDDFSQTIDLEPPPTESVTEGASSG